MTLSISKINEQIKSVKELYLLQAELEAEIEKIETSLKETLKENNETFVSTENGSVTYKEIVSNTLDTTKLKKSEFAFIYEKFLKKRISMRFKVA